jgi:hypothetical protein
MAQSKPWSLLTLFACSLVLVGFQLPDGDSRSALEMANACPTIERLIVSPMKATIGDDITVSVVALDGDGDEIGYQWAASGGSFANPSVEETTYRCDAEGPQSITVTVSDAHACTASRTARVVCVE